MDPNRHAPGCAQNRCAPPNIRMQLDPNNQAPRGSAQGVGLSVGGAPQGAPRGDEHGGDAEGRLQPSRHRPPRGHEGPVPPL